MSTIDDLKRKVQSLRDQLAAAESSLYNAQCEAFGLSAETVLIHDGKQYAFARASHFTFGKPWVYGFKRLKSGGLSDREKWLCDRWEIKKP